MQSQEKDNLIFIRLFPGEDINQGIIEACNKHEVKSAVVLSGIGQLKNVKLGYFKTKGDYSPEIFKNPIELISLTGNICKQDKDYILHNHVALGDENKQLIGGHLIEGSVKITAEIVLLKNSIDLTRKLNKETGLMDLNLK
jgi:predicted DNA-binding protein with PD1-like motif